MGYIRGVMALLLAMSEGDRRGMDDGVVDGAVGVAIRWMLYAELFVTTFTRDIHY